MSDDGVQVYYEDEANTRQVQRRRGDDNGLYDPHTEDFISRLPRTEGLSLDEGHPVSSVALLSQYGQGGDR